MKKETKVLFELLKNAVFGREISEQTKTEASENAELLYKMARHHDLAHLVEYAFRINGIKACDETAAYELLKSQALAVMRYEDLNLAISQISELFEKEKIPFVPLKGAVIRSFYPEPWMRTSCDVDILVHEDDLDRAEKALVDRLGYKSKETRGYHDVSLYSDTDVHLELHFNIKENRENIDGLLERVWDYALPKSKGAFEYILADEFLYFQHIAHMSYHVVDGGCSIRYFMDLLLLDAKLCADKAAVAEMLRECGLEKFSETSLKLARIWFSEEEHDEITPVYEKYLLGGGIYGTKMNAIAAKDNKKSTFSYAVGRIFMPYEKLCITYPNLKGKKYLLPFYQVKRWFRTLKNRRYLDASKEFEANNSITKQKANDFSKLFESLELK